MILFFIFIISKFSFIHSKVCSYFLNLTFNMENHSLAALTKFGEKSEVYDERYF